MNRGGCVSSEGVCVVDRGRVCVLLGRRRPAQSARENLEGIRAGHLAPAGPSWLRPSAERRARPGDEGTGGPGCGPERAPASTRCGVCCREREDVGSLAGADGRDVWGQTGQQRAYGHKDSHSVSTDTRRPGVVIIYCLRSTECTYQSRRGSRAAGYSVLRICSRLSRSVCTCTHRWKRRVANQRRRQSQSGAASPMTRALGRISHLASQGPGPESNPCRAGCRPSDEADRRQPTSQKGQPSRRPNLRGGIPRPCRSGTSAGGRRRPGS